MLGTHEKPSLLKRLPITYGAVGHIGLVYPVRCDPAGVPHHNTRIRSRRSKPIQQQFASVNAK